MVCVCVLSYLCQSVKLALVDTHSLEPAEPQEEKHVMLSWCHDRTLETTSERKQKLLISFEILRFISVRIVCEDVTKTQQLVGKQGKQREQFSKKIKIPANKTRQVIMARPSARSGIITARSLHLHSTHFSLSLCLSMPPISRNREKEKQPSISAPSPPRLFFQ